MAYKNITGFFGHEWISEFSVEMILKELPESHYRVWVGFTNGKEKRLLKECSRKERFLDSIIVEYRDGTNRHDPDPFTWVIFGPVEGFVLLNDSLFGAKSFFSRRCKSPAWPQTKNEDPRDIFRMRTAMRHKLAEFLRVSERSFFGEKDAPLKFVVNLMNQKQRARLLGLIGSLDGDGIWISVEVEFPCSTIDQLQRLDTEIELQRICMQMEE